MFLEIMIMLFVMMTLLPLTASPKGQTQHGHFLPKGLERASSPLTVVSRRKPVIQMGGIYTDENIDTHRQGGQSLHPDRAGAHPGT